MSDDKLLKEEATAVSWGWGEEGHHTAQKD
jgi:hypothetical protein